MKWKPLNNNKVLIHQSLHGYADGHRLLASSIKLPSEAARNSLLLSDMSGPNMIVGYETYLTGYPLPEANSYAFARTWYADEMSRPGCVWTHTLLIENSVLAQIQDLRILLKYFLRPFKHPNLTYYQSPIEIIAQDVYSNEFAPNNIFLDEILFALYEIPDQPIYIISDISSKYEESVIILWSQQWARLRRSFLFCTGSIANRKAGKHLFDLQVIPSTLLKHFQKEIVIGHFSQHNKEKIDLIDWVNIAVNDLLNTNNSKLRSFLWILGAEISDGRKAFPLLVKLYGCAEKIYNKQAKMSEFTELIRQHFPEAHQAPSLKKAIFGPQSPSNIPYLSLIQEKDKLWEITTTTYHTVFDKEILEIRQRARIFLKNNTIEAKQLILTLLNTYVTPFGEEFLIGISEAIDIVNALDFISINPKLLYILIKYNISLLETPQIWPSVSDEQRELFDYIITHLNINSDFIHKLIIAILEAGIDSIAASIVSQFGDDAIIIVLDWFNNKSFPEFKKLGNGWWNVLKSRPSVLITWLSKPHVSDEYTQAFIARMLDPDSSQVINLGAKIWLNLAKSTLDGINTEVKIESKAFLLALGLNNPDPAAVALVRETFEYIHDVAAYDNLKYDSWKLLKNKAPSLAWLWEWDKCERLRYALIEHFIKYDWPIQEFILSIKSVETFRLIISSCSKTKSRWKFLKKIQKMVDKSEIVVTSQQKDIINSFYW